MIQLCCPNSNHDSSYLEALACTEIGSWRIIDRVGSIIVIYSHNISAISCHAIILHHPPEI